jgi:hypothetical protein
VDDLPLRARPKALVNSKGFQIVYRKTASREQYVVGLLKINGKFRLHQHPATKKTQVYLPNSLIRKRCVTDKKCQGNTDTQPTADYRQVMSGSVCHTTKRPKPLPASLYNGNTPNWESWTRNASVTQTGNLQPAANW